MRRLLKVLLRIPPEAYMIALLAVLVILKGALVRHIPIDDLAL